MDYPGLMVSVSGVRGRVGEALTPEIIARFAAGFGAWALARGSSDAIVVGRDSRVSGPMFHRAVDRCAPECRRASDRRRNRANAHHSARGRAPPRSGRPRHHRKPQPDRMERAQVHRAVRTLPRRRRGTRDARRPWKARSRAHPGTASEPSRATPRRSSATSTRCSRFRSSTSMGFGRTTTTSHSTACAARAGSSCRASSTGSAAR